MDFLEDFLSIVKRNIVTIGAIALAIVSLVGSVVYVQLNKQEDDDEEVCVSYLDEKPNEEKIESENVKVDVKGAVKKPGVYELAKGMTIMDALTSAGGVTTKGTTTNVNLSKKLTDEMVVYIFTKDELKKKELANEVVCEIPKCECETIVVNECPTVNGNGNQDDKKPSENKKVSINNATLEEFLNLDGIGESKAKTIIEYREKNGPFASVEDIKKVSGIGDAVYEKIKDNLTL